MTSPSLIIIALLRGDSPSQLTEQQWGAVVGLARQLGLLGTLYFILSRSDVWPQLSERIQCHFLSGWQQAQRQKVSLQWQAESLAKLNPESTPFLLLKGAAYILADLPNSHGRIVSDIDVLVDKASLNDAEFWLFVHGFKASLKDDYDDYYYRQWMHELPPFYHPQSHITLDLHHNILPIVSKRYIEASALFDEAQSLENNINIPSLQDLFIHSAAHLFQDSVFHRALRDLYDMYHLHRLIVASEGGDVALFARAQQLGLADDVARALDLLESVFAVTLAEQTRELVHTTLCHLRHWRWQKPCYLRMLMQPVAVKRNSKDKWAEWLLFSRSHLIKMPLGMLLKHSVVKSIKQLQTSIKQYQEGKHNR